MNLTVLDDFVNLFYPKTCFGCGAPLVSEEHMLCLPCLAALPFTDYHNFNDNKVANVFMGRVHFQRAAALLHFYKGGRVQQLLHHLKYSHQPELGVYLGAMAAQYYQPVGFFKTVDFLVPIPLHPKKLAKRGYNQSEEIVKGMHYITNVPIMDKLIRTENNATQTRKGRFDRWLNVETVFAVQNPKALENKHLLLVDDVLTTGSTIEAAATKLLAINGVRLSMLTLATAD